MIIQENNLEEKCLELISRTLVDLGQVKPADEKVDSDEFHLCGKTMSKWLYRIKKMIWEGWYNDQHGAKHLIDNKTKALLNNQKLIG